MTTIQGYAIDWSSYTVLKADEEGVTLQLKHVEIKTSDGCIFGGYDLDFPVKVKYEDLPLPEEQQRKFRWVKRMIRRLSGEEMKEKLGGMSVQEYADSVYASVIAQRGTPVR